MKDKFNLSIDKDKCIVCEKCVKICTSCIFTVVDEKMAPNTKEECLSNEESNKAIAKEIGLQNQEICISCGHCVAICPTNAITHNDFPPEKVFPINRNLYPTAEEFLHLCKARRSNRAFSKDKIPQEHLMQIIEAAHLAPTAMNTQQVEITLITDTQVMQQVSEYTINTFEKIRKTLENPFVKLPLKPFMKGTYKMFPKFKLLKAEYDNGKDLVLRDATALVLFSAPKQSKFGCHDCNLAYQNASLMAECLGIAHFYTGFVYAALQQDKKDKFLKKLGVEGKIYAGMALAMPIFEFERYIERKGLKINYFV